MTEPELVAQQARGLIVFRGLLNTSPVQELIPLLQAVSDQDVAAAGPAYAAFLSALLDPSGTVLDHLARALLYDENLLARASVPAAVAEAARADLRVLKALAHEAARLS